MKKTRPRAQSPSRLRHHERRCARCGIDDGFDFYVRSKVWKAVAGPEWYGDGYDSVLCLSCFDQLAEQKGIDYAEHVKRISFVGAKGVFDLQITRVLTVPNRRRVK